MTPWDPYLEEKINAVLDYIIAYAVIFVLSPFILLTIIWEKIR